MNNITEIEISKLLHHPQNPRKDLGDLTELADSIRVSGIMQNLTVVQEDDHYLVVIGNRRMEAANKAGLKTVPCAVVEMSAQEQLSTMMVENMQRSDLTILEQAQGFQLMMDMGDTVDSIAEKTGFSTSTVRRRVKLMELDQVKLKKVSSERQISMSDLDELNKISDIRTRNSLLSDIGTGNFQFRLTQAVESEKNNRKLDIAVELMKKRGIPPYTKGDGDKIYAGAFIVRSDVPAEVEKEFENRFGKFSGLSYERYINSACIYVYRDRTESEKLSSKAAAERQRQTDYCRNIIRRVNHDLWLARLTFIRSYKEKDAREHFGDIAKVIARCTAQGDYHDRDRADLRLIMQIDDDADDETVDDKVAMAAASTPSLLMLWTAYDLLDDSYDADGYVAGVYDGNPGYNAIIEEKLNRIYAFLIALGYEMSEEEEDIRDGVSDYCFPDTDVYKLKEGKKQATIDDMDLDVRTYNALKRAGITSADELIKAAEDGSLFKVVRVKYKQLVEKAAKCGITLPESSGSTDEE